MADETMKQGIAGASYDTSKVFDPSKLKAKADEAPKIAGLDVSPNAGVSTTAGANYYAGQSMPSGPPMAIAGGKPQQQQPAAAQVQPIGTIAGMPAESSTNQTSGPLGMPGKPPAIAGVNAFSFDSKQPAGGLAANNSASDWSSGSRNAQAIAGTSGLGVGPTSFSRTFTDKNGQQQTEQLGTLSNRGIAGLNYDEQVAFAKQFNSPTAQAQRLAAEIPYQMGNQFDGAKKIAGINAQIAGLQKQTGLDTEKYKSDKESEGSKYTADQGLAGHKLTADANVKAHEIDAIAGVNQAITAGVEKTKEQQQKDYSDRVKGLVSDWSKLNVPTDVAPKLNYYAQIHAQAEDPNGKLFMLSPNRQGGMYAALPKQYESHYQRLLKTMNPADAAARIYAVAQKNRHAIDVPDFNRFQTKHDAVNGG